MTYNRTEEARQLLSDIDEWCARTGTPSATIGHVLFLHPGFVGLLRKRLTLSVEKEIAARAFIFHDHPDGWHGDLPKTHGNGTRPVGNERVKFQGSRRTNREIEEARQEDAVHVDRDPCPRCGTRGDIGCSHSGARLGTSF